MKTIHEKWVRGILVESVETDDGQPENPDTFADKSKEVTKRWWEFWK